MYNESMDQFLEVCLNEGETRENYNNGRDEDENLEDLFKSVDNAPKHFNPFICIENNKFTGCDSRMLSHISVEDVRISDKNVLIGVHGFVKESVSVNLNKFLDGNDILDDLKNSDAKWQDIITNGVKKENYVYADRQNICDDMMNDCYSKPSPIISAECKRDEEPITKDSSKFPCNFCNYIGRTYEERVKHVEALHPGIFMQNSCSDMKLDRKTDAIRSDDLGKVKLSNYVKKRKKFTKRKKIDDLHDNRILQISKNDFIEGKLKHNVIVKGQKRGPKSNRVYDTTFPCSQCTYRSTRKFDLKRHVSTVHNKERPFSCKICSFSAGLAENLKQHMLKMHNDSKFKCSSCNFVCAKKLEYLKHLKTDHNYVPYGCDDCDFTCLWPIELNNHRRNTCKNIRKSESCANNRLNNEVRKVVISEALE